MPLIVAVRQPTGVTFMLGRRVALHEFRAWLEAGKPIIDLLGRQR